MVEQTKFTKYIFDCFRSCKQSTWSISHSYGRKQIVQTLSKCQLNQDDHKRKPFGYLVGAMVMDCIGNADFWFVKAVQQVYQVSSIYLEFRL